jgi:hypothetical protein
MRAVANHPRDCAKVRPRTDCTLERP